MKSHVFSSGSDDDMLNPVLDSFAAARTNEKHV
jgi:hypothetical protein